MIHIGSIIKQKMKERNCSVVWLSRQMSCSRVNVYKLFDKYSVDTETLHRLSVILDYDFFRHYSKELETEKNPDSVTD